MRQAKESLTTKRTSVPNRVVNHNDGNSMDEDDQHFDGDEDSVLETNLTIGDPGELCLDKVESLLGIQSSGKVAVVGSESTSELTTRRSGRKVAVRKKIEERQGDGSSSSSRSSKGSNKPPKVTLKLGMPSSSPAITVTSNISNSNGSSSISSLLPSNSSSSSSSTASKSKMKIPTSERISAVKSSALNGSQQTTTSSDQQVSSGGPQTPRTPGTPSDHGAHTPNPPTPGNTNSSSGMVSSPHQYVTITVDGEGGVGNEGGVSVGGSSSYVTYVEGSSDHSSLYAAAAAAAANGQTMTYPVYTVGDSSAMYSGNSTQYYAGSSETPGVTYSQDENDEGDDIGDITTPAGGLTSADLNSILSCGSGDSSIMSSSPEADAMFQQHALLDGGVYMVPASGTNNNNNSGTSEGEGPSNLSHATRVSPATPKPKPKRKKKLIATSVESVTRPKRKTSFKEDYMDEDNENECEYSQSQDESVEDGSGFGTLMSPYLSESEIRALSAMHPMARMERLSMGSSSPAKMSPEAVQWLLDNYETAEGVSLPRSTLYCHYLRHCSENKLDPVNAASFGKLIRSVFLGLRTRRLGTRGNSKYHYYGIRLKPGSPLNNLPDDFFYPSGHVHGNMNRNSVVTGGHHNPTGANNNSNISGVMTKRLKTTKSEGYDGPHTNGFGIGESISVQQYLGDPNGALEDFPDLVLDMEVEIPEGLAENDLVIFRSLYREHCESMLEALANFQLGQVEALWRFFWRSSDGSGNLEASMDYEKILPKSKLALLCGMKIVQEFVKEADYNFYQKVVGILLPNVLRPIPSTMTQAIRNFAKTLENWLSSALMGYSKDMVVTKITVVSALAQTLRRYTSLNHLAQAARAVLQNQNQITQMLSDLNRVDFHNVEEQASWVCGCDGDVVPTLEQDFKATLAQQQSLEEWATWLEGVVDRVLHPHVNTPRFIQAARHFLLKWSFYSSLIIRDLTLRSAASFGSFHLLRLLYDEYMFYLVEHRVAQTSGIVPIAVIGKKSLDTSFASLHDSIESSCSVNGHSDLSSDTASTPVIGSVTSMAQEETHTNNNTTASSYKSEPRKNKFLVT